MGTEDEPGPGQHRFTAEKSVTTELTPWAPTHQCDLGRVT